MDLSYGATGLAVSTKTVAQRLEGPWLREAGIPAVTHFSGGKPKTIKMEHVWVEAWLDYFPSRGRIHKEGDTWVPLDATYKQHTYTQGTDIKKLAGLDDKTLQDTTKKSLASAKTGPLGELLKAPDIKGLEALLKKAQAKAETSAKSQKLDIAKLLGTKTIVPFPTGVLGEGNPYKVTVEGTRAAELPDKVRYYLELSLTTKVARAGPYGGSGGGTPDFTYKISLPELCGKKLSLAYNAATPADVKLLKQYLPKVKTLPNKQVEVTYPSALPAVLQTQPSLLLDGKEVAKGKFTRLGWQNRLGLRMRGPLFDRAVQNYILAGERQAVVLNPSSIAQEAFGKFEKQAKDLRKKLEEKKPSGMTQENTFGTMLHAVGLLYWSIQDASAHSISIRMKTITTRLPSLGLFSVKLNTYRTGFVDSPLSTSPAGFATDVDFIHQTVVSTSQNRNILPQIKRILGIQSSAWEASVWELLTEKGKINLHRGISSIHVLRYAAQQGIPIYSITKKNAASFWPKLSLPLETINEYKNAVAAGKTVFTPQRQVRKDGWEGVGYIIQDELTGAASYRISGGMAGGLSPTNACGRNYSNPVCKQKVPKKNQTLWNEYGTIRPMLGLYLLLVLELLKVQCLPFWAI